MKKILIFTVLAIFGMTSANAQNANFGAKAGYTNITPKINTPDGDFSEGNAGFFIGLIADIALSEKFAIQPEVLYANADDTNFLYIPIMAKFYLAEGLNIQAGPQINYVLEEEVEGLNNFGFDLAFGAGYDITENFFVDARYGLELSNRLKDAPSDVSYKINTLMLGIGYKF